jgi:prepilin-type N-terminal cleavage/methylation domain-containing protein
MVKSLQQSDPMPPPQRRHAAGAFTLVEILIVITILAIVATIAIPQFSSASQQARENALKDELRYLRTQIAVYKAQHEDRAPGYPGGNTAVAPTAAAFVAQMTQRSDIVGNTSATASATFKFGPYLSRMPTNPFNGLDTVLIVGNGQPMPAPDGSTGFIYKPQTLEIIPNLTGTDASGQSYASY